MTQLLNYTFTELDVLNDEELIERHRQGDTLAIEILMQRYKVFVRNKIKTSYFVGADKEDLIQEGMIGVFKAINDYDASKKVSFKSFANLCMTRQLSTAFKLATRQKHKALNTSISLDIPITVEDDKEVTLIDIIDESRGFTPEEELINKEQLSMLQGSIKEKLSKLEWQVLMLHTEGEDYREIAKKLGKSAKTIDNALQRIKRKVRFERRY